MLFFGVYIQDRERLVTGDIFQGYDLWVWFVVLLQVAGGVITACVMKFASNILKCLAIACSICCCAAYSVVIGELKLTATLILGVLTVCISVAGYSLCQSKVSLPEKFINVKNDGRG